jgi:murein DD-endopeptidase MepM/ murein hydrolase activator NlpD
MVLDDDKPRDPFDGRLSRVRKLIFNSAELYEGLLQVPARAPIAGRREITSGFGMRRDPFIGSMAMHSGLDFRAAQGESVMATAPGEVTYAAGAGGYGNMVEVTHTNGFVSRYAHLSAILVQPGQHVRAGQRVGRVGSTGRSTGPHLHYELKLDDKAINPRRFLAAADLLARAARTSRDPGKSAN